jgi:hypothetical protein
MDDWVLSDWQTLGQHQYVAFLGSEVRRCQVGAGCLEISGMSRFLGIVFGKNGGCGNLLADYVVVVLALSLFTGALSESDFANIGEVTSEAPVFVYFGGLLRVSQPSTCSREIHPWFT